MENSSKNNIDDIFKKTFEGFEHEPSGRVWGNVRETLRSKGRSSIFMSFTSVVLLLSVAGTFTYALLNNDAVTPSAQQAGTQQIAENKDLNVTGESLISGNSDATIIENAQIPVASIQSIKPNTPSVQAVSRHAQRLNAGSAAPRQNPVNHNRAATIAAVTPQQEEIAVSAQKPDALNSVIEEKTEEIEEQTPAVTATGTVNESNENQSADRSKSEQAIDNEIHPDVTVSKKSSEVAGDAYKPKSVVPKTPMRRAPFTNPDKSGPAIIVYYSPEISFRALRSKDPNFDNMVLVRNKYEKPAYAFSYGIKLEWQFKKHLAIQLGAAYAERGEAANYSNSTALVGPFKTPVAITLEPAVQASAKYNTYKFIEFPIIVSYWLGKGRSLMAVSGGVCFSDLIGSDAIYMSKDAPDVMIVHQVNYTDLAQTTTSVLAGFSYSYRLNQHFSILLDPVIRYALNSTNKAVSVKEHQYSGGVNVGLRYKISTKNFPRY